MPNQNTTIWKKLLKLQETLKPIQKELMNDYYNHKYFDVNALIDNIKKPLLEEGILCVQCLVTLEDRNALKTLLIDSESGDNLESVVLLPELNDVQKLGSAITYLRRYSLQAMLFLQAEDDDGNNASQKAMPAKPALSKPIPVKKTTETSLRCDRCGVFCIPRS